MNRFEDEISEALRRKEPPAGFADRVIARAAAPAPAARAGSWRNGSAPPLSAGPWPPPAA